MWQPNEQLIVRSPGLPGDNAGTMPTGVFDQGLIVNEWFAEARESQVAFGRNSFFYPMLSYYFTNLSSLGKNEQHKQHGHHRAQKCGNGYHPDHALAPVITFRLAGRQGISLTPRRQRFYSGDQGRRMAWKPCFSSLRFATAAESASAKAPTATL